MIATKTLIARAYSAFNDREIDGALAFMTEDVCWPKASEGGHVVGKEEIRSYWIRQWKEYDPHVEPLEISEQPHGIAEVKVRQIVKNLRGEVLANSEVLHVYTIASGFIKRMDLKQEEGSDSAPSSAFSKH